MVGSRRWVSEGGPGVAGVKGVSRDGRGSKR